MTKRVFITGYYGFGNTGDEAILAAMVAHLREQRADLQITATSATPEATSAALGIQTILWSDAAAMMEAARTSDLVVIGGGGIFHDYLGVDPGSFLTDNHWGITFYTAPAAMATLFNKPVMLYAVGVGPIFSDHGRSFTKFACEVSAKITVRDAGSGTVLESLGVPKERIVVTADAAFGLPIGQEPVDLDGLIGPKAAGPRIAVALRPWNIGIDPKFWKQEVASGLDRFLDQNNGSVLFVPFQRLKGSAEDDTLIAQQVHSLMKHKDRASVLLSDLSPQQIVTVLAQFDLVIGMRLHSLILGMLARVPVLALSYDAKVHQLMERTGLQIFTLEIRSVDSGALFSRMERALAEKRIVSVEGFADAARRNARLAIEILDRGVQRPDFDAEILSLLGRGIQAQLRESHELRETNRRFFHEFEHYQKLSSSQGDTLDALSAQIVKLEAERIELLTQLKTAVESQQAADDKEVARREEFRLLVARVDDLLSRLAVPEAHKDSGWEKAFREIQRSTEERNARIGEETAWMKERDELIARADRLAAELAASEAAASQRIARIESESARKLQDQRQQRAGDSDRHSALRADLEQRIAVLESELEKQRRLHVSLDGELRDVRLAQRAVSDRLTEAGDVREKSVRGLDQFQLQFNSTLDVYRSQRAWKAMLAIRKAYTLLTRHGPAAFVRWTLALPFAGPGTLDEFDLRFPNIWNYVPERLATMEKPPVAAAVAEHAELVLQRKYDLVVLAIFDFEFRFQRPQQIAAQFARLGHRVFWVSPARFIPESAAEPYEAVPLRENIWEARLRGVRPDLYGGRMNTADAESYGLSLERLYSDFHIQESCAFLQFPYWRQAGLNLKERFGARVVYDCMDDWQNWTAEPRISDHNLAEENKLANECEVLVVSAQQFYNRHASRGLKPLLVRNGADYDFFAAPRANDLLAEVKGPIIGYYGAIADWFDLDLLTEVAESRPQYTFVIIGQVHEVDISRFRELPNVQLLGEKNYREIPLYLSHFDVCLIPFKLNSLTQAVDPVKLYEYFSQAKPVVATNMGELPRDTDLIYIGKDVDDFAKKVDLAVAETGSEDGAIKRHRRLEYAQSNTWALRCRDIDRAVRESFPRVSILIVTYNCEEFIGPCLDSIFRNTSWPNYEIVVIDNCSTDQGAEIVERYAKASERIRFTRQQKNIGFAGGNNIAAQQATGDYLLLLNPDVLVPPGWMGRLVHHCEIDQGTGAVAAVTNFSGNETKISFSYANSSEMEKFAGDLSFEKANQSIEISVAPLYCVLVPRLVWDRVGGLDPGYQIGMFEDDDFSHLVKKAGYRVIAAEDCFVHHFGNGSFAKLPPQDSLRIFDQNKQYFEDKWKTAWQSHKLRPGVRPPGEEMRFAPSEFVSSGNGSESKKLEPLVLRRLHPSGTVVGQPFNLQPNGLSALVADCANATPTTVIMMDSTILATAYGSGNLLSAMIPAYLLAKAGHHTVHLSNDFGDSNRIEFEVEP